MDQQLALRVPASDEGLRLAAAAFDRFRDAHGIPLGAAWKLQVALDEVLSNVVKYAFAGRQPLNVDVEFAFRGGVVRVTVSDDGPRFNPLEAPAPRTDLPLEQRRPGGLGIALVRSLTDEARYEWRDGRNALTMAVHAHA